MSKITQAMVQQDLVAISKALISIAARFSEASLTMKEGHDDAIAVLAVFRTIDHLKGRTEWRRSRTELARRLRAERSASAKTFRDQMKYRVLREKALQRTDAEIAVLTEKLAKAKTLAGLTE